MQYWWWSSLHAQHKGLFFITCAQIGRLALPYALAVIRGSNFFGGGSLCSIFALAKPQLRALDQRPHGLDGNPINFVSSSGTGDVEKMKLSAVANNVISNFSSDIDIAFITRHVSDRYLKCRFAAMLFVSHMLNRLLTRQAALAKIPSVEMRVPEFGVVPCYSAAVQPS